MKRILVLSVFLGGLFVPTALMFFSGCREARKVPERNFAQCLSCHRGIEAMGREHPFPCVACHLLPRDREEPSLQDHRAIVRNPSDPSNVRTFCMPCHEKEILRVESSLHATMAGIINQTRYLWGAQGSAWPAVYGLSGPLALLPEPNPYVYPETPALLVDDFLRRRCLRCHIHTKGPGGHGLYRATGCAACHVPYDDDGLYRGNDPAIERSRPGYPSVHRLTAQIPNRQCRHCHNQNRVGADYEGRFEHDYHTAYRSPDRGEGPPPFIYAAQQHGLAKDIHAERGLWCIDCHGQEDVMGNGKVYGFQMEAPKRRCSDCHGGFTGTRPGEGSGRGGDEHSGEPAFVSRGTGRKHRIPLFSKDSAGHRIPAHGRVRCSACHAQWSYQDFGMSVIREDVLEGEKWSPLSVQGDPATQKVLEAHLQKRERSYPASRDWISRELRPGVWSVGWRFRRWEWAALGMDHEGRYAVLRPLYQYLVTYVDRVGNVPLDSVRPMRGDGSGPGWAFMPYVPHTTSLRGKSCERCHTHPVAAGLGLGPEHTLDTILVLPSPPAIETMDLPDEATRERLLRPSEIWRKERLKTFLSPSSKQE